ncbi:lipase maturation factor family protein [Kitasatospora cathayae]|uniref:Lipase maturation factor family protein n=1 Tax=Kitasatospora cathayae TaxID=3004092 RepID=A0ABY7PVX6_9ACTN|nr:lipase maturation factor family protein [Kitasatospora sp. HUAS 3-15]WBP84543.1 lipase maturation factor family protein [Kitasatospora sp. HUAS 3-15]
MEWFSDADYWLGRLLFQRGLAVVYFVAFLSVAAQFRGLIGERGLLPASAFVARVRFVNAPSVFHLHCSDRFLAAVIWTGVALSAALAAGAGDAVPLWASILMWLATWAAYLSIVNVGQTWFAYMWESLLAETGFLAIFLGNADVAPPILVLWLLRWLLFRLEVGAGLIKLRGDSCWRDLTCLYYHHETQPMPGPLSWFFHHLPKPVHRVEAAANHLAQLLAPFALFAPQPAASAAAVFMIVTQLWLIASGNFAWLNWLAVVLALSVLGTGATSRTLGLPAAHHFSSPPTWYEGLVMAAAVLLVALSYWPARNLVSRRQIMNASFNPLHLVNTYGAFGSIGRARYEIVVEGTDDREIGATTVWKEYAFKGKPGDVRYRPSQIAPYHLRLDWQMWFAAISPAYAEPWFPRLLAALLDNNTEVLRLIGTNPFREDPPTYVRARLYRYRFTEWRDLRATGAWWHRTLLGDYVPPVALPGRTTAPRH